jgi:glycosyltransferase involved in cell wall biosynthesis
MVFDWNGHTGKSHSVDSIGNPLPRIGFIGSMNAMPMGYALKFVRDGFDVKYVVEAPRENALNRPEHHFPRQISYPYPPWVREHQVRKTLLYRSLPFRDTSLIRSEMRDRDVLFLNDYGLALAPFLRSGARLIALSSGGDLDVLCDYAYAREVADIARGHLRYPLVLGLELLRCFWQRQGLFRCQGISYFPPGLNRKGDRIVAEAAAGSGAWFIPRYDVNFDAANMQYSPPTPGPLRRILVPVRVNIDPLPSYAFEYKGNDLIIKALGIYRQRNPGIEVHMVKKGRPQDLVIAFALVRECGLEANVIWHDEMPLAELLSLYDACDVCFDQVGSHWMGAVGCYALYSGRPLIANARLDVFSPLWGKDVPILDAVSAEQIVEHLVRCEDYEFRKALAVRGHEFAVRHLDSEATYTQIKHRVLGDGCVREAEP